MRREWARRVRRRRPRADRRARRRRASTHGVELVYCISPGLSIRYSSAADADALVAKLASVAGARGAPLRAAARRHPRPAPARGRRRAVREPRRGADARSRTPSSPRCVTAIPAATSSCARRSTGATATSRTSSSSAGGAASRDRPVLDRAGRSAPPPSTSRMPRRSRGRRVARRSTGTTTRSTTSRWATSCTSGPYRGRRRCSTRVSRGVIANGMELFESSKIAFATIADYLWSPRDYDPEASWDVALRDVVGEADVDAYRDFADNVALVVPQPRTTHRG